MKNKLVICLIAALLAFSLVACELIRPVDPSGGTTTSGDDGTTNPGGDGTTNPGGDGTTDPGDDGTTDPGDDGTTAPGDDDDDTVLPDVTIQNEKTEATYFYFQNAAGISMRLSYEGVNGWRFQAVKPSNKKEPYKNFNNQGAGQSLALFMNEPAGEEPRALTVTTGTDYIRVTEAETGSYVDIATDGAFNVQFYSPEGEAMNNINSVSSSKDSLGQSQITLTGALKDKSEEAIFGGGQRFDSTNKRGLSLSLYTYDAYNTDGGKGTYAVIPLFLSTRGSGLFINRYERMTADFDVTTENQWTIELLNNLMDCYIYTTGDMTDALNGYANISGYAIMPEEWAQGTLVCAYNPDFQSLDGEQVIYAKLSDIPEYKSLRVNSGNGASAETATIAAGTYLFRDGVRSYYYDGTSYYRVTKKGNPAGYGVRQIVTNLMNVGMKPDAVIIEALDYAWLNCTLDTSEAKENRQKIKDVADWLHENDIKLLLYMGVGQMSAALAGVKDEYYVRADVTIDIDESINISHGYTDRSISNTEEIPWVAVSDNPDAIGTNYQKYLDVTNPEAVEWYMDGIWGQLLDLGVDGCKLDFCEMMPDYKTPLQVMRNDEYVQIGTVTVDYKWYDRSVFGDNDIHHAYPTYFSTLFKQRMSKVAEEKGITSGFVLNSRGGGIGVQRNATMWGGDLTRSEKNLSSQLKTMLNSGISGIAFTSYDMGGYAYDTEIGGYFKGTLGSTTEAINNQESRIYLRAVQFTAFTTMIQAHGDVRKVYEMKLTGNFADDYVPTVNERYINLRNSLQSYIRKWSEVSCTTGMPLVRHLALQYQDDANTWNIDDQFMLGDAILVAPIIKIFKTTRDVYLPEGKWQNMLTGEIYEVGAEGMTLDGVEAELDQIPVFLNMEAEDYESLLTVFNGADWQAINRGYVFTTNGN